MTNKATETWTVDIDQAQDKGSTLIDSTWVKGTGVLLTSTTPDEKSVLWNKSASSAEQVNQAVKSAKSAQQTWQSIDLASRIRIVQQFCKLLTDNKDAFAKILSAETGKPRWEAQTEISACVNKIDISIQAQKERAGSISKGHLTLTHQAHGVMAVFGPFNFPLHLPNGHIIPALLAGNTLVFKPSEQTPYCAEIYAKLWLKAGLPPGVINLVQGGIEVGEALAKADINGLLFTGSFRTGQIIHRQLAGRPDILLALEMGGNNPMIVGSVDNLDLAANTILHSAFLSAGQRCTCTRRLIVVNNNHTDALLEKLANQIKRIILANNSENQTPFMGPVINRREAERIMTAQQLWLDKGGKVITEMVSTDDSGVHLSAGLIDVSAIADMEDEEYFGPLLQLIRVDSFEQALTRANATRYGLAAGLISDSPEEQVIFKQGIRAGVISINLPTAGASSALPFGGVGHSGNHRPSAYYAADYCAWPQALSEGDTSDLGTDLDIDNIRGLR